jgi:hypothetical protein
MYWREKFGEASSSWSVTKTKCGRGGRENKNISQKLSMKSQNSLSKSREEKFTSCPNSTAFQKVKRMSQRCLCGMRTQISLSNTNYIQLLGAWCLLWQFYILSDITREVTRFIILFHFSRCSRIWARGESFLSRLA